MCKNAEMVRQSLRVYSDKILSMKKVDNERLEILRSKKLSLFGKIQYLNSIIEKLGGQKFETDFELDELDYL